MHFQESGTLQIIGLFPLSFKQQDFYINHQWNYWRKWWNQQLIFRKFQELICLHISNEEFPVVWQRIWQIQSIYENMSLFHILLIDLIVHLIQDISWKSI